MEPLFCRHTKYSALDKVKKPILIQSLGCLHRELCMTVEKLKAWETCNGVDDCLMSSLFLGSGILWKRKITIFISFKPPIFLHSRFLFPWRNSPPPVGHGLLITEDSRSYSDTLHSVGLLCTGDRPVAETSTWQHTTHNKHPCPRWDSNRQSQQASGRRPTPCLFVVVMGVRGKPRMYYSLLAYCTARFGRSDFGHQMPPRLPTRSALQLRKLEHMGGNEDR
jgi:hypothetical protein